MSMDAHDRCSRAIRFLRFNWIQNPEVILNEKVQTVGLTSDYLKNDPELIEVFQRKLYRRLDKRYRGLLDFIVPVHFIWQTKIKWQMLKGTSIEGHNYERIKNAITTSQFRKRPILEKISTKLVVNTRSKQLKNNDLAHKHFKNLMSLEQENMILKTLGVLQRKKFTWKTSPIKVLKEKLRDVGLQLDVFKDESILFSKLKNRLGRKFPVGEFYKYYALIRLINQKYFQW